jgi:hypothetical protein
MVNSVIQGLAERAKSSVPQGILGVDKWIEAYNQKLAELIIEKCAEIADTERPNSFGCGYVTKTKGMLIKEYFGVNK